MIASPAAATLNSARPDHPADRAGLQARDLLLRRPHVGRYGHARRSGIGTPYVTLHVAAAAEIWPAGMEQRIRYCAGPAGRKIAYAVVGEGPALVCPAWWVSHLEKDWGIARFREFFSALTEGHTLVRYDRLGAGLSDRDRTDFTLGIEVMTLEAVVQSVRLERFALFAQSCAAPTAVAYCARHPDRVTHLVLCGGFLDGRILARPEVQAALVALVRASWGLGSRTLADVFAPGLTAGEASDFAALQRASATADMSARLLRLTFELDAEAQAAAVRTPTLVLHRRHDRAIPFEAGRHAAAHIPDAELVPLEGERHLPWYCGDADRVSGAVLRFLEGASPALDRVGRAQFLRRGDFWEIGFGARTVHVRHMKGLADLAELLARPGQELEATRLAGGGDTECGTALGADPVLDPAALRQYRRRLSEIDADVGKADGNCDVGRLARLASEREALLLELRSATGLGGRARRLGDPRERARKAVSLKLFAPKV